MTAKILSFTTGVLKMYVSSQGNFIPAGSTVDIYRVQEGKDLYVKVSDLSGDREAVILPYYGTSEDTLLA